MKKRRVVGRICGMKHIWKGHKDRNRHKDRIKKEWARLAGVCQIQRGKPQHPHHVKVCPWRQRERERTMNLLCLHIGLYWFDFGCCLHYIVAIFWDGCLVWAILISQWTKSNHWCEACSAFWLTRKMLVYVMISARPADCPARQKFQRCKVSGHYQCKTVHDSTTHWALPVHITFTDLDHISRSRSVKQFQLKISCFYLSKLKLHKIVKYVK